MNLRPATAADVGPLAELIYTAALANARACPLDVTFGTVRDETLDRLGWMVLNLPENPGHFSRFTVAETGGRVASALCLHTKEGDSILTWRRVFRGLGYGYPAIAAGVYRMRSYFMVKPHCGPDSLIVGNVATFSEYRGMGAASLLLNDAIARVRDEGRPRLELECQIGNPARRVYEKAGFAVTEVKTSRSWAKTFGTAGVLKMTLEL
jgi:GNAT superfamily N-acetyltransferase